MKIPPWNAAAAPRDPVLVQAIRDRRGGKLLNLDLALLWSEPLARGWNAHLRAVRQEFALDARLREIAICTVARLTGADYEFDHHWPHYVAAGGDDGAKSLLDNPANAVAGDPFSADERLAMRLALEMTRNVKVPEPLMAGLQQRFTTTELVELIATIATYNMVARFLVAAGVEDERKA